MASTELPAELVRDTEFVRDAESFRRELLAHCYRMLGSVDDAEDLVQETYLRAWRSYSGFEGRSSLRTWLYQIATNACLTALGHRSRRVLPVGLGGPGVDPEISPATAGSELAWLQPIPDALVRSEADDPATIVAGRASLRLALIASLQYLPSRQRAVLILRDVLAFPAAEVATMLEVSTAAVKSLLQRARARIEEVAPAADQITEPAEPEARAQLDRYMAAFENSDANLLRQLLSEDATLELMPSPVWFSGGDALATATAGLGTPGDWRMIATSANGQPAALTYHREDDGSYRPYGVVVLTASTIGLARISVFGDPGLVTRFVET
jgi:RNA polymerase sigma-70 factor (ECF subfamily)